MGARGLYHVNARFVIAMHIVQHCNGDMSVCCSLPLVTPKCPGLATGHSHCHMVREVRANLLSCLSYSLTTKTVSQ